jgi:hypothetical protein
MLDGKALVDLDRWASMRQAESVGPQLTGLFLEFQYNMRLLASMKNTQKDIADHGHSPVGSERLRLVAAEVYLAHPVLVDRLDVDKIVSYWHDAANVLNAELDRLRLCRGEPRWTLAADLLEVSERICTTSSLLKDVLQTILTELGPIAGM